MSHAHIGYGYDLHALIPANGAGGLMVGGICVSSRVRAKAHSDGDVLLHALCDALLGAAGLGDIGEHFPDTDPAWQDIDSAVLVEKCIALLNQHNWQVVNVDTIVHLEKPLLGEHKSKIRARLASLLEVGESAVNIKATRGEQLDAVGRGQAIAAQVVCLLQDVKGQDLNTPLKTQTNPRD